MSKRILTILGTRPDAIKMAPVLRALRQHPGFESRLCVTAQHREMLDQVLNVFDINPDHDLNLMEYTQTPTSLLSRALIGVRDVLCQDAPDCVLVQGDTSSCLAGALAAFYEGIPIGHVEAGLRTGNLGAPFPEEANRRLVAQIASYHFAPTEIARNNLLQENIPAHSIFVTGNTVIDSLVLARRMLEQQNKHAGALIGAESLRRKCGEFHKLILVTGHRRENSPGRFSMIGSAIGTLAAMHPNCLFVYPVHPNTPYTASVHESLASLANVELTAPLDYLLFVWLMVRADLILTDSGGIQEEALALGKPLLVMRDDTERTEAVTLGTARLIGNNPENIVRSVGELLTDEVAYCRMAIAHDCYGDGTASARIVEHIARELGVSSP
jgi:UDP-N-acetylglucosamine 2-epimerase (non-hydrolysing)